MLQEAEEFAAEDAANKRRIEALHELSTFVWQLESQVSDLGGLGGRLSTEDKGMVRDELKSVNAWMDEQGHSATAEEIEERLTRVQAVINPIATRLYQNAGPDGNDGSEPYHHIEL